MVLFKILAILLLALVVVVPLLARFGKKHSDEEVNKISRWILPLVMLLAVMQLLLFWMGK
jgi:hypothetical protein